MQSEYNRLSVKRQKLVSQLSGIEASIKGIEEFLKDQPKDPVHVDIEDLTKAAS